MSDAEWMVAIGWLSASFGFLLGCVFASSVHRSG